MSQVAKSASALVRAFLAILVLELDDMVVRLVYPPKLAGVHGDRWTVRTSGFVQVFGCRHAETIRTLGQPASEKRQGTKSRGVGHRQCSGAMGIWRRRECWGS